MGIEACSHLKKIAFVTDPLKDVARSLARSLRAERQVVGESMDVGTGYRIGLGIGVLSRLSARFGLLFELEAAHQHVSHIRHFARRDGSADEVELPITYDLRWLGAEVRFGIFPVSVVVRQESINERFSAVPLRAASRAWRSSM